MVMRGCGTKLRRTGFAIAVLLAMLLAVGTVAAQEAGPPRQSLDDAWWTGPMLANSA